MMSVVLRIVLDGEPGTLLVPESNVTQANMAVLAQNDTRALRSRGPQGIRTQPSNLCEANNRFRPGYGENSEKYG